MGTFCEMDERPSSRLQEAKRDYFQINADPTILDDIHNPTSLSR